MTTDVRTASTVTSLVLEEFRRLREDFGATVIVVTHSPAVAASADRVVEIRDGKVVT